MKEIKVKDRVISPDHPVYVIAEMAYSHDGSPEKASFIIREAAKSHADAISIHITSMQDYMVPHYGGGKGKVSAGKESNNMYSYLDSINLAFDAWGRLIPEAKALGIDVCVMCNDRASFDFVQDYDPDMYVISASAFMEEEFVRVQARTKKPLILRVGGAHLGEIEKVILWAQEEGNNQQVLLFGLQNYPTAIDETHLSFLDTLRRTFSFQVGLADHLDADDPLSLIIPLLAIPYGATVIEKHITHNRGLKGEDFESALNPDELKMFVSYVRQVEKAIGSNNIQDFYSEMESYRQVARKRMVAACKINKDEELTREKITFKRSDQGTFPDELRYVLGRKVNTDINVNEPITFEKLY